jgi:hypothetical protein
VTAEVISTVLILASQDEAAELTAGFRPKKAFVTGRNKSNQPVKEFYYES